MNWRAAAGDWPVKALLIIGFLVAYFIVARTRVGSTAIAAYVFTLLAFFVANLALEVDALWAQIAVITLLVGVALFFGLALALIANSVPHVQQYLERSRTQGIAVAMFNLLASFVTILVGFSALHALLYQHGVVSASDKSSGEYLGVTVRYYLWQLAAAVPALDIPNTLNLRLRTTFNDQLSGGLALGYRIIIVFAVLKAFGALALDWFDQKGFISRTPPSG
jgi:hypothetical protein